MMTIEERVRLKKEAKAHQILGLKQGSETPIPVPTSAVGTAIRASRWQISIILLYF